MHAHAPGGDGGRDVVLTVRRRAPGAMVTAGARWRRRPEMWRVPVKMFTAGRAWDWRSTAGEGTGKINKNRTGGGAVSV